MSKVLLQLSVVVDSGDVSTVCDPTLRLLSSSTGRTWRASIIPIDYSPARPEWDPAKRGDSDAGR